ncbi:unnamed protein product, partial [Polarella glacialis]
FASAGATSFIATGDFLAAIKRNAGEVADVGRPLMNIAEAGRLELLTRCSRWDWLSGPEDVEQLLSEEALMPLTQLPALRKELRDHRFRSPALAGTLEPFPMLFEDLLDAWLGRVPVTQVPPAELAQWARCRRFRRRPELLEAHLAAAGPEGLATFSREAPLAEHEVLAALRPRFQTLLAVSWQRLVGWDPASEKHRGRRAAALFLSDHYLLRRLWNHGVLGPRQLIHALLSALLPTTLLPLRVVLASWRCLVQHGLWQMLARFLRHGWWAACSEAAAAEVRGRGPRS